MSSTYSDAVAALYRAPQEHFVAERKRLAAELKAAGDKAGAAQLGKLARPTLSAWAVNQLWWLAQPEFEELFASSERLRRGEHSASAAHRDALTVLRNRAASLLGAAGHAVNDATLRRVTSTLSALAAAGGFDPDPAGALSADRDPPGFEAWGGLGVAAAEAAPETPQPAPVPRAAAATAAASPASPPADDTERERARVAQEVERRQREQREQRVREQLERERQAREQREAERARVQTSLAAAQEQLASCRTEVQRVEAELAAARHAADHARSRVAELEQRLRQLDYAGV